MGFLFIETSQSFLALAEVAGRTNGGGQGLEGDAGSHPYRDRTQSERLETAPRAQPRWWSGPLAKVFAACGAALVLAGLLIFRVLSPLPSPRVLQITQLTHFWSC